MDAARLEFHNACFLFPPERNPFRSLYPQREPTSLFNSPLYYHNNYMTIVRGRHVAEPKSTCSCIDGKWAAAEEAMPSIHLVRETQI
jgi:hypothetical protein